MQILSLLLLSTLAVIHRSSCIPVAPLQLPHLAYISIPEVNRSNTPLTSRQNSAQEQEPIANESSAHSGYARTFGSMGLGGLGFRGYSGGRDTSGTYGSSSLVGNLFNAGNGYRSYGWYGNSPSNSYGGRYSGGTLGTGVGYLNGADSRYGGGGGWRG